MACPSRVLAVVAGSRPHRAPGGIGNASEIDREICTAPSAKAGVNKAQGYEAKLKDIDRYIDPNLLLMW